VLTRIAWKNHKNGREKIPRRNSRRKFLWRQSRTRPRLPTRSESWIAPACRDGSAAAIVVRAEDAHKYCKNPIYIKALSFIADPRRGR